MWRLSNGVQYHADSQPDGESTFFLSDDKSWGYRDNKDPNSKGKHIFDVAIQGRKVLENFNIRETAMGVNRTVTLEFTAAVRNNRLEVHLYWTGKGSIRIPMEYYGPLISAISVSPAVICKLRSPGRKKLQRKELKGIELLSEGSFNFRQIKAATQNFNPVNKIGEGGYIFKWDSNSCQTIVIKMKARNSRLLGCCTEDNQLLLVYEYMENNSLAHALFCKFRGDKIETQLGKQVQNLPWSS
ncbi:conserved hypothetical protein [Ricinus communis]|uniref:non-specific serine/threonine protein kinase n=1 Tax=Ricinus communis TaxID=3988 RepID=B9S8G2_RICCO|nr:conserved hypothetical protein [Ricinus communis]